MEVAQIVAESGLAGLRILSHMCEFEGEHCSDDFKSGPSIPTRSAVPML